MVIEQVTNYLFPVIIYLIDSVSSLHADAHTTDAWKSDVYLLLDVLSFGPLNWLYWIYAHDYNPE